MPKADEPNMVVQLAVSYNERGVAGYTASVTNSFDQKKVNLCYEAVKNTMTGKGTLSVVKRPGVTIDASTFGSATQTPYLLLPQLGGVVGSDPIVFSTITAAADLTASTSSQTTTIAAATGGHIPRFVDKTRISNVEFLVLQTRTNTGTTQRVFFSSDTANLVWSEITDADFTGLVHRGKMEHIDGYAFILASNNLIWNSDTNSLANWTATSFLAKQIRQDYAVGLMRHGNKLLAMGSATAEVFFNGGNTTGSPLSRVAHQEHPIGLVDVISIGGTHYYATLDDKIYFVGRRAGGSSSCGLFSYDGFKFEKVSNTYVDKILSQKNSAIYSVFTVGLHGQAGIAIGLTNHSIGGTQRSFVFFPDWKDWFEWTSTIFSPVNSGGHFLSAVSGGFDKTYSFPSTDNWQDNGTSYAHSIQFRIPSNGASRNFLKAYGLDADTDTTTNDQTIEISRDDTATWETLGTLDMTQDRKMLFRGGSYRKGHIRIGATNARPFRAHQFLARVE